MPLPSIKALRTKEKDTGKQKGFFWRNSKKKPEPLPIPPGDDEPGASSSDAAPPAERTENELPSQQDEQALTLWEAAAKSLEQEDRDKLDVLIKSKREEQVAEASSKSQTRSSCPDADGGDSLQGDVNRVLSTAQKLAEEDEKTWRPVSSTPCPNPQKCILNSAVDRR